MVVIVTRDVADRFRGFLSSCMVEIAPGVYTAPRMTQGIRERVWAVLAEWFAAIGGGCIVMTWRDRSLPAGQGLSVLGLPPRELVSYEGCILLRRPLMTTDGPTESATGSDQNP